MFKIRYLHGKYLLQYVLAAVIQMRGPSSTLFSRWWWFTKSSSSCNSFYCQAHRGCLLIHYFSSPHLLLPSSITPPLIRRVSKRVLSEPVAFTNTDHSECWDNEKMKWNCDRKIDNLCYPNREPLSHSSPLPPCPALVVVGTFRMQHQPRRLHFPPPE